ncbi:MAG: hypothetical protein ACLVKR_01130 [Lachnospiraceae bacterium]
MTLNELLEKKRREFDNTRALLNEFAGDCFLSKEDPRCDARLREVSEKINELSIEIMLLENCEELLSLDKLGETKE